MQVCTSHQESLGILKLAVVKPKCLLINVAEQVKRHHTDIGSFQAALQQTPEVLYAVSGDVILNIRFGMVDYLMNVIRLKTLIGMERVSMYFRTLFYILSNLTMQ